MHVHCLHYPKHAITCTLFSADKMDLYEKVYFCRPVDPANTAGLLLNTPFACRIYHDYHHHPDHPQLLITCADDRGVRAEIRFKDAAACLKTFRNYIKLQIRCLITRGVYAQAKASDLSVKSTTDWNVRSCQPRSRRDQVQINYLTFAHNVFTITTIFITRLLLVCLHWMVWVPR